MMCCAVTKFKRSKLAKHCSISPGTMRRFRAGNDSNIFVVAHESLAAFASTNIMSNWSWVRACSTTSADTLQRHASAIVVSANFLSSASDKIAASSSSPEFELRLNYGSRFLIVRRICIGIVADFVGNGRDGVLNFASGMPLLGNELRPHQIGSIREQSQKEVMGNVGPGAHTRCKRLIAG